MRKKIAIVAGGYSSEYVISVKSAAQVLANLDHTLFDGRIVEISREGWLVQSGNQKVPINKDDFSFSDEDGVFRFDAAFIAIHGNPGENGILQGYFDLIGIPYTSCDAFTSMITFNKFATKSFLKDWKVPMAKGILIRADKTYNEKEILELTGLPCFVKPNNGGSSFGISRIEVATELPEALDHALKEDDEFLVEEFIQGREFSHGVMKLDGEFIRLPVTEIVSQRSFFDYEAKYQGFSKEITPAELSPELTDQVVRQSEVIYEALGCSGMVRIDYILRDQVFYMLEVNTVPGMSRESIIPQQIREAGYSEKEIYGRLINDAIHRKR